MKIRANTVAGFLIVGVILVVLANNAKGNSKKIQQLGLNREDYQATIGAAVTDKGVWLVDLVLTNFHGVTIVKLNPSLDGQPNVDARYAVATDPRITNGVIVRLLDVSHSLSPNTVYEGGNFNHRSTIAVLNSK
jgi:hypothetical protein